MPESVLFCGKGASQALQEYVAAQSLPTVEFPRHHQQVDCPFTSLDALPKDQDVLVVCNHSLNSKRYGVKFLAPLLAADHVGVVVAAARSQNFDWLLPDTKIKYGLPKFTRVVAT